MKELKFRNLRADEIQVRPTDTKTTGSCMLLLFQDARCAMNILDETVGCDWQKDYKEVNGNVYCGIAIKMDNEWVWRWDCGSMTAKDEETQSKADASDAFKRAAVNWGIGRELYSTPKIRIKCPESYYWNNRLNMAFSVREIVWDGDTLLSLVIVDRFGNVVYSYGQPVKQKRDGVYIPQNVWDAICAAKTVAELASIWAANTSLQDSEKFKQQLGKKKAELRRPA